APSRPGFRRGNVVATHVLGPLHPVRRTGVERTASPDVPPGARRGRAHSAKVTPVLRPECAPLPSIEPFDPIGLGQSDRERLYGGAMSLVDSADQADGNAPAYSVSELAGALKRTLEDAYGFVRLRGEVSKVTRHASGHVYLSLKDERAAIDGVI